MINATRHNLHHCSLLRLSTRILSRVAVRLNPPSSTVYSHTSRMLSSLNGTEYVHAQDVEDKKHSHQHDAEVSILAGSLEQLDVTSHDATHGQSSTQCGGKKKSKHTQGEVDGSATADTAAPSKPTAKSRRSKHRTPPSLPAWAIQPEGQLPAASNSIAAPSVTPATAPVSSGEDGLSFLVGLSVAHGGVASSSSATSSVAAVSSTAASAVDAVPSVHTPIRARQKASSSPSQGAPYATPASAQSNSKQRSTAVKSPGSSNKFPPSPLTQKPYFAQKLRPDDAAGYRAAGLLAYRVQDGKVQFLLGREGDQSSAKKWQRLNLLGGKIDQRDSLGAVETAVREFFEESGALLGDVSSMIQRVQRQQQGVMWCYQAKYALFLYELTTPSELGVVEAYSIAKAVAVAAGQQLVSDHTEMLDLHWVDGQVLVDYLATQKGRRDQHIVDDRLTTFTGESHPVVSFTVGMLNVPVMQTKLRELVNQAKRVRDSSVSSVSSSASHP